jgi:hypothetical protein
MNNRRGKKVLKGEKECDPKENEDEKKYFSRARNNMIRNLIKSSLQGNG